MYYRLKLKIYLRIYLLIFFEGRIINKGRDLFSRIISNINSHMEGNICLLDKQKYKRDNLKSIFSVN